MKIPKFERTRFIDGPWGVEMKQGDRRGKLFRENNIPLDTINYFLKSNNTDISSFLILT